MGEEIKGQQRVQGRALQDAEQINRTGDVATLGPLHRQLHGVYDEGFKGSSGVTGVKKFLEGIYGKGTAHAHAGMDALKTSTGDGTNDMRVVAQKLSEKEITQKAATLRDYATAFFNSQDKKVSDEYLHKWNSVGEDLLDNHFSQYNEVMDKFKQLSGDKLNVNVQADDHTGPGRIGLSKLTVRPVEDSWFNDRWYAHHPADASGRPSKLNMIPAYTSSSGESIAVFSYGDKPNYHRYAKDGKEQLEDITKLDLSKF